MLERQCNAMQKAEAVRQLDHTCADALGTASLPHYLEGLASSKVTYVSKTIAKE